MSLNKKYTWKDFLKEHPEHKEKKTKRTSKDGQKAFEAAYKQHIKEYLKGRLAKIDNEQKRATKKRQELSKHLKALKEPKKAPSLELKIGHVDAYVRRLEKMHDRTKMLQKNV